MAANSQLLGCGPKPEGPSTQSLRSLVPDTIEGMVFGPETSNIGYLDSLGTGVHGVQTLFTSGEHKADMGMVKGVYEVLCCGMVWRALTAIMHERSKCNRNEHFWSSTEGFSEGPDTEYLRFLVPKAFT